MATPNVTFVRSELAALLGQYRTIRDCLSGSEAVKAAGTLYLPMPNAADTSPENKARYAAYLKRAVFYNVTRRTLYGLVGQVFSRDPVIETPTNLLPVLNNASGGGVDITQLAKKAVSLTLAYSRSGIFVDYPTIDGGETVPSLADIENGTIRPTISMFAPQSIVNWRLTERGADEILSLVVIFELFPHFDDGFETKNASQYRVLMLDENGNYVQQIWREATPTEYKEGKKVNRTYAQVETINPVGADGLPLREIPFMFIGSENNDSHPDNPNLYDLADLNIAHYRNSADYEESAFIVGQPTPVVSGVTQDWIKDVLNGSIDFGSRGGVMLPEGGTLELVQAEANTMIKEAMETKERQMTALGAKLVEQKTVQRTATEAMMEATSESSTLSTTAKNVSSAFEWALKWCAEFLGDKDADIKFELNSDYDISKLSPEARKQAISEWQVGATSFSEMRSVLRKSGSATLTDEEVLAELATEEAAKFELEKKRAALTQPTVNNVGK